MPLLRPQTSPRPQWTPLRVVEVAPASEGAVAIAFDVSDPQTSHFLSYRAGQYLTLSAEIAGERVRQSYSLWTAPQRARAEGRLRIAAAHVQGGRMSPWLARAVAPGDTIEALPPRGDFVLIGEEQPLRHVVIAGGSGITPVLAIMEGILQGHPASTVELLLANRSPQSIVLREQVEALARSYDGRLNVRHVLSRQGAPWARSGRISEADLSQVAAASSGTVDHWWLCGPKGLLDLAAEWLAAEGVAPDRVHQERFTSTGPVDPPHPPTGA